VPGFVHTLKVGFQHCDPAGIVFYPRYFEMLNATIEAWFETRLRLGFAEIHGPMRRSVPTRRLEADFSAPARLGDVLDFSLSPRRIGGSSCDLRLTARCDGAHRATFTSTLVWVNADTGRPERWPDALRARIRDEIDIGGNAP
jgi:4-hydroxybenzoyl-CoA thioesterase